MYPESQVQMSMALSAMPPGCVIQAEGRVSRKAVSMRILKTVASQTEAVHSRAMLILNSQATHL